MKKNELRKWRENYTPLHAGYRCVAEGIRLNVHFDEKDYLRQLGAKWQPHSSGNSGYHPNSSGNGGYWWMPTDRLGMKMKDLGYRNMPLVVNMFNPSLGTDPIPPIDQFNANMTILDWLNTNKMATNELHGALNATACTDETQLLAPTRYRLSASSHAQVDVVDFLVYSDPNIVFIIVYAKDGTTTGKKGDPGELWKTTEDAKSMWDSFVNSGYVRMDMDEVALNRRKLAFKNPRKDLTPT